MTEWSFATCKINSQGTNGSGYEQSRVRMVQCTNGPEQFRPFPDTNGRNGSGNDMSMVLLAHGTNSPGHDWPMLRRVIIVQSAIGPGEPPTIFVQCTSSSGYEWING